MSVWSGTVLLRFCNAIQPPSPAKESSWLKSVVASSPSRGVVAACISKRKSQTHGPDSTQLSSHYDWLYTTLYRVYASHPSVARKYVCEFASNQKSRLWGMSRIGINILSPSHDLRKPPTTDCITGLDTWLRVLVRR